MPLLAISLSLLLPLEPTKAEEASEGRSELASEEVTDPHFQFEPILTGSPRQTMESFYRLRRELEAALKTYGEKRTSSNLDAINNLMPEFRTLLDLSEVPEASSQETADDTTAYLLDILGRVPNPDLKSIPDDAQLDGDKPLTSWRIPKTPIFISEVQTGSRSGEFLFNPRSVVVAPTFFDRIEPEPLKNDLGIKSWSHALLQISGPLIPHWLVEIVPTSLKRSLLDTPIWKIALVGVALLLALAFLYVVYKLLYRVHPRLRFVRNLRAVAFPLVIVATGFLLRDIITYQINVSGLFATLLDFAGSLITYLSATWIYVLIVLTIFEAIILSPKIADRSLDADLLRLCGKIVAFLGAVVIIGFGAQSLGLPVLSILTGLGIGGLAVALALRPTIENMFGGLVLFMDRPVRVGDFCAFGDQMGTIVEIGVRSTKVKALDQTLITVPNATFADYEIINYAACHQMLIRTSLALRYDTPPDRIRFVLVKLREMLHAHPKIDANTIRVRFTGYQEGAQEIDIRIYADTRDWSEFYAIKEDVMLRVNEIIQASGASFALTSHRLFVGKEKGVDESLGTAAEEEVKVWRRRGRLPFPRLSGERLSALKGTLDYPPRGSQGIPVDDSPTAEASEPLSAPEEPEEQRPKEKE